MILDKIIKLTNGFLFRCCKGDYYYGGEAYKDYFFKSLVVGIFTMTLLAPIAVVVLVPVMLFQIYKIIYSFSIRFLFCCCT